MDIISTNEFTRMSDDEYRDYLKKKLKLNTEELNKLFKSTFFCLKKNLEKIANQPFIESLMSMQYDYLEEFDGEVDDYEYTKENSNLHQLNCDDGGGNFKCICGKKHLKYLNIFTHEKCEKKLVIGSSCIKQVSNLSQVYIENEVLTDKLVKFLEKTKKNEKEAKRKNTHNPCNKCKNFCIKKNYNYKEYLHNFYCKDCLICDSYILCNDCHKFIRAGEKKPIKNEFKDKCGRCWYLSNHKKS